MYICGAVKHPGVYKFTAGSRINDAINAASGFKKGAARTAINQARVLEDGEQITIPTLKQVKRNSFQRQLTEITFRIKLQIMKILIVQKEKVRILLLT